MKRSALTATPLVVIALAGCGGDGDANSGAADAEAISSAEWIKQADAICQATDKEVEAIDQPRTVEDVGRVAGEIQELVAGEIQELRELPPPEDIGGELEQMLSLEELEVKSFDAVEAAASTGDEENLQSVFEETEQPGVEANRIAKNLGMEECEEPYG